MFRTSMTLDRTQRAFTAVAGALVVCGLALTTATGARAGVLAFAIGGAALALAWAMSPKALVVDGAEIRVERRGWPPLRVPRASIVSAAPLQSVGGRALRLFGVGGFFGSYGLFWSSTLGRFRLYATRSGQAVILRRSGDALPIVLTPDDVAGTIGAIDERPQLEA
jgi:hypothetical protein